MAYHSLARVGVSASAVPPVPETTTRRKTMKHMGQDERRRIKFILGYEDKVADISRALGMA